MIVAPALAARIMGAGVGEENAFWVSPVLSTKGWTEGGNAGGQRTWLAPEAGPAAIFFSADGATWNVPMALDPGDYHQIPVETGGRSYRMALEVHTADGERYPIAITRSMRLEDGPIAPASCAPGLRIRFWQELFNAGTRVIDRRVGLWSIIQLPCEEPGTVFFGLKADPDDASPALRPYFTSRLPEGVAERTGKLAWLRAQCGVKLKVGLSAALSAGSIAFVRRARATRSDGRPYILTAITFPVDPTAAYLDKPNHAGPEAALNGDAAQAYTDPGIGDLAFCEIEAHAPAPRLDPGESIGAELDILIAHLGADELDGFLAENLAIGSIPRSAFL
jgi:hypothetical protein